MLEEVALVRLPLLSNTCVLWRETGHFSHDPCFLPATQVPADLAHTAKGFGLREFVTVQLSSAGKVR